MSQLVGNHPKPVMYMSKPLPVRAMPVGFAGFRMFTLIPKADSCDEMSRAMFNQVESVDWALSRVRVRAVPLAYVQEPPAAFCVSPAFCIRDVAVATFWLYGFS